MKRDLGLFCFTPLLVVFGFYGFSPVFFCFCFCFSEGIVSCVLLFFSVLVIFLVDAFFSPYFWGGGCLLLSLVPACFPVIAWLVKFGADDIYFWGRDGVDWWLV